MRIALVTPAPRGSRHGNRITASRWAGLLRELGHRVEVGFESHRARKGGPDLLIALHARRSFEAIRRFRRDWPSRPLVVALTGTDLYRDIRRSARARDALAWADRLVVLQPAGLDELDPALHGKTRVIRQSALPPPASASKAVRTFDICVVGHLRPVKDPFRAALAARSLPSSSRIRVLHAGAAMTRRMADRAEREMRRNPRYRWLGDLPRWRVRRLLGRSHVMVLPSVLEGGANVLSEALVAHLPVLASRIPGSVGMLGARHPGLFTAGRTAELADLMERCESRPAYLADLAHRSRKLADKFRPEHELAAWKRLLAELPRPTGGLDTLSRSHAGKSREKGVQR